MGTTVQEFALARPLAGEGPQSGGEGQAGTLNRLYTAPTLYPTAFRTSGATLVPINSMARSCCCLCGTVPIAI
jgi:hypothetical protein